MKKPEPIIKCDSKIQTELHPIPRHIDATYHWNEWDLKREAIKLVSFKLDVSHFVFDTKLKKWTVNSVYEVVLNSSILFPASNDVAKLQIFIS
jgi:hypothetical protein